MAKEAHRADPVIALDRRLGVWCAGLMSLTMLGLLAWRHAALDDEILTELARVAAAQRASLEWVLGKPVDAESGLMGGPTEPADIREAASALLWQWQWREGRVLLLTSAGEVVATTSADASEPVPPPILPPPTADFVARSQDHVLVQRVAGTGHQLVHTVSPGALRALVLDRLWPYLLMAGAALLGQWLARLVHRRQFVRPAARLIEGQAGENGIGIGHDLVLPSPWSGLWAQARRRAQATSEREIRHELEEARLAAAIQAVSDAILIVDAAGRPVTVNDAFLQLLPPDAAGVIRRGESLRRASVGSPLPGSSDAVVDCLSARLGQPASVSGSFTVPLLQGGLEVEELPTTGGCRIWISRHEHRLPGATLRSSRGPEGHTPAVALMGRLARELADPLALLVSQTRRLRDEAADDSTRFRAERAQAAAERCAELVDTCRAIAGDRPPRFGMILADELVDQVLRREAPALEAATIAVARGFAPNPPPVWGDAEQLDTVFSSLLANARDALLTRPVPRRVTVRMRRFDEQLLIDFEDNGPGIAPAMKGRLLEPFATTKGDRGGTGLGLAYCRGIMGLHSGSMHIEAGSDGGTKVTLGLPIRRGAAEPTAVTRLVLTPPTSGRAKIPPAGAVPIGRTTVRALTAEIAAS